MGGVLKEDVLVILCVITAVQSLTIYLQLLSNYRAIVIRFQVRVLVAVAA